MKRLLGIAIAVLLALAAPLGAQDSEASRLERLIQNSLSGAGRDVTVRGFSGALSGRAEMASLTIADSEGVWLTLTDAVLDWNRAALLRGRLSVAELSAARIEIARAPVADASDPISPEASGTGFQLPELPVSLSVEQIAAEELVLGAPLLGQALTATLEGALQLADGAGEATFDLVRVDGPRGEITLDAAFSNATGELAIDLLFDEAADGVAAGLLGLPGAPALRLSVIGAGPLDDFTADLALATDGTERFGGTIETLAAEGARQFVVDLDGDLRPLVEPQYRTFFGERTALGATAQLGADGATQIERLQLDTGALTLSGNAAIGADGVPEVFDLAGRLADPDGGQLLLPLSGPETRIGEAELTLAFDASVGDEWRATVAVTALEREGFSAARLALDGAGTIAEDPVAVTAGFDFSAEALAFGNAGAQEAIGEVVTGRADIAWTTGGPVMIEALRVTGESYEAEAEGRIANAASTLDLDGSVTVRADDLDVFSGLAGRPLGGSVRASVTGRAGVISGLADLRAAVVATDLAVDVAEADPYLAGETSLEIALRRTTAGVFLDTLRVAGSEAELGASGTLRTGAGTLSATARLGDLAPLADGLSGPGEVSLEAEMTDAVWTWALVADAMATALDAEGTLTGAPETPLVTAAGTVAVRDLGAVSELAGRPLGGSAELAFSARAEPATARYSWDAEGTLSDIVTGLAEADRFLEGTSDVAVAGALSGQDISLDRLDLTNARIALEAEGAYGPEFRGLALEADARLTDLGDILAGTTGPARLTASVVPDTETGPWAVDLAVTSPLGEAVAEGRLSDLAGVPEVSGSATIEVADLAPIGQLLDRPLGGSVSLAAEGSVRADLSTFDITLDGTAQDAASGIGAVDRILAGTTRLQVDAERAEGTISVRSANLETPLLAVRANGTLGEETAFDFSGRLADVAPFVDGFSGPLTAEGTARDAGSGRAAVDVALVGPAGARANVAGTVAETGADAALSISGSAPLGLVNGLIAPRAMAGDANFDLRLSGPLALDSLSGRITTRGALLTAPVLDLALENITATIDLARSRASVDIDSTFRGGGAVRVDGPVSLGSGLAADLDLVLDGVRLSDPALYRTVLDARLGIDGPLAGGAAITGRVDVGETELQIPTASGAQGGGIPDLTHVGEPAPVRATRQRAGLIASGNGGGGGGGAFALDILVNAPNRIFVRGRGLDAELGGRVQIGGTTQAVAPAGRFDLIRGRLDILGRRLDLTQGSVELTGALDPRLRLVAETEAEDVNVSIIVEGLASNPEISFASQPELPQDEVLALLLFGRGIETLSPLQIARLAGAIATLGSSGGGLLGGLRQGAGLADLDVTSGANGGAAVRAGAYISDNIYTDITVDTNGEAVVNLNLDLSRSVTVRGSTSNTGNSGVGVFFERDY